MNRKLWSMDLTIPPHDDVKWSKNLRVHIAGDTLEEAIAKARAAYPTAALWSVKHQGILHLEA